MARFAETARRYWQTYLPSQYATIEDPETFFRDLSEQVEDQIAAQLTTVPDVPAGASPQERVAIHEAQRRAAQEVALADLVFLRPEPGTETKRPEGRTLPGWDDDPEAPEQPSPATSPDPSGPRPE